MAILKLFIQGHKPLVAAVIFLLAVLILILIAADYSLETNIYAIKSPKITSTVRLALISDLHSCKYGENQQELIAAVKAANPDVVLFSGDIADDTMSPENGFIAAKSLASDYPCFYVSGNHELRRSDAEAVIETFSQCGLTVLRGDRVVFDVDGQSINICGIDDPQVGHLYYGQLKRALDDCDNSLFTLLVAHRPELIDKYAQYSPDLVLSGHAHGGHWRLPSLGGLIAPGQGLFPKYTSGVYEYDGSKLLVSRGLSKENIIVPRFFNPPELVIIDLIPDLT